MEQGKGPQKQVTAGSALQEPALAATFPSLVHQAEESQHGELLSMLCLLGFPFTKCLHWVNSFHLSALRVISVLPSRAH